MPNCFFDIESPANVSGLKNGTVEGVYNYYIRTPIGSFVCRDTVTMEGEPKKNIYSVNKSPLIGYTIDAALGAHLFTNYIVSTDCEKIADVANLLGADVPFMRPDE